MAPALLRSRRALTSRSRQAELRKSSLYNVLTADAHVGNIPASTVDILEGDVTLPSGACAVVADLPGFYSVEATVDAGPTRRRTRVLDVKKTARLVVVQVLDPTRLALGLRLTRRAASRQVPLVVCSPRPSSRARATPSRARSPTRLALRSARRRRDRATKPWSGAVEDHRREGSDAQGSGKLDAARIARAVVKDVATHRAARRRMTERLDSVLLHPVVGPVLSSDHALLFAASSSSPIPRPT